MRRSQTQGLSDIIRTMKRQYGLEKGMTQAGILRRWETVVGKAAASYTDKIYFRNDILFVHLRHPVLRHELSGQREKLRKRLNNEIGYEFIKEIVLK